MVLTQLGRDLYRCFEPAVLERMSSHYETKKPLSRELADKINKRYVPRVVHIHPTVKRELNAHLESTVEWKLMVSLFLVVMSTSGCFTYGRSSSRSSTLRCTQNAVRVSSLLVYHNAYDNGAVATEQTDYTALWNDLRKSITQVNPGRRAAGQGSFGHIAGGYDAGYYGWVSR